MASKKENHGPWPHYFLITGGVFLMLTKLLDYPDIKGLDYVVIGAGLLLIGTGIYKLVGMNR